MLLCSGSVGSNVPPKSLQELLEKQWEQTAQFIIDQAGRRNNGTTLITIVCMVTVYSNVVLMLIGFAG